MKTLGLCMIVGPGDGLLFQRCIGSMSGHCFSQIVAVVTTGNQADIDACKETGVDVILREWASARYPYGDFAGARNEALKALHTDYAMWLDSDDIFINSHKSQWDKVLKAIQTGFDIGKVSYVLEADKNNVPTKAIFRERIWRIGAGCMWKYPVHEQLLDDMERFKVAELKKLYIYHKPNKVAQASLGRNLSILEHEYNRSKHNRDRHIAFYYARDLFAAGERDAGASIAKSILSDFTKSDRGDVRLIYETCDLLARYYLYEDTTNGGSVLKKSTAPIAEVFARVGAGISPIHAEPLIHCGDVLLARNENEKAEVFYKKAMADRTFGAGGIQDADYYSFIPACRLAAINKERGDLEQALIYNKVVLDKDPGNAQAVRDKKEIVCDLLKEVL